MADMRDEVAYLKEQESTTIKVSLHSPITDEK
jgi:hypothetical protein